MFESFECTSHRSSSSKKDSDVKVGRLKGMMGHEVRRGPFVQIGASCYARGGVRLWRLMVEAFVVMSSRKTPPQGITVLATLSTKTPKHWTKPKLARHQSLQCCQASPPPPPLKKKNNKSSVPRTAPTPLRVGTSSREHLRGFEQF